MLADLLEIGGPPRTGEISSAVDVIMGCLTMMRGVTEENVMIESLLDDVQKTWGDDYWYP